MVASDLPGMADVIRTAGVGVLCDPKSPASIARGIRQLLDRSPRERAATRAHVLAMAHERYNWESQVEALFGLYAELGAVPPAPDWRVSPSRPPRPSRVTPTRSGPRAGGCASCRTLRRTGAPTNRRRRSWSSTRPGRPARTRQTAVCPAPGRGRADHARARPHRRHCQRPGRLGRSLRDRGADDPRGGVVLVWRATRPLDVAA